jgi:hypothetical protein
VLEKLKDPMTLLFICAIALLFFLANWERERRVNETLQRCLSSNPEWARELFDPQTPAYKKHAIQDLCFGYPP